MEFLRQDCRATLREGLTELYCHAPDVSDRKGKRFRDHDLIRFIFGCDTSLEGEILLKPWILFGTTITVDEIKVYQADPEVKRLNEEGLEMIGGRLKTYILAFTYYFLMFFWIWLRQVRKMSEKWPHSEVTEAMLDTPLDELRRRYGITLYRCRYEMASLL